MILSISFQAHRLHHPAQVYLQSYRSPRILLRLQYPIQDRGIAARRGGRVSTGRHSSNCTELGHRLLIACISSPLDVEVWDWAADTDGSPNMSAIELDDDVERTDRWELVSRRRPPQTLSPSYRLQRHHQTHADSPRLIHLRRKRRRRSRTISSAKTPAPHARIHIPLLSLIISLLSIEESTVHLLTHSTHHSVLFPGHDQICSDNTEDVDREPHGMTKLLLPAGETHSLKEGCAVACDSTVVTKNPFIFSPFRLAGLWDLVGDVMVNGGKALREIFL
jgi:hypothetical protein